MNSGGVILYITPYGAFHTVQVNDDGAFESRGGGVRLVYRIMLLI